ncbi:hypothetical protein GGS23DRAFT_599252 [Durotheca rogersii]|uniref:uncharacterized protein n=1 Tax=Durotheca rogersii TaxID=419775 RepID=UPI0022200479|nr:uncharacterized protein GGS23DRAFT_599252 [Durotheca rogersii]KAI5860736.1 hypothetical protein GGS23DRAFT_599252 [Durotheca rogersii]
MYRMMHERELGERLRQYYDEIGTARVDAQISNGKISRILGQQFRNMPEEHKKFFLDMANREAMIHRQTYPWYKYRTRQTNADGSKVVKTSLSKLALPGYLETVQAIRDYHAFLRKNNFPVFYPSRGNDLPVMNAVCRRREVIFSPEKYCRDDQVAKIRRQMNERIQQQPASAIPTPSAFSAPEEARPLSDTTHGGLQPPMTNGSDSIQSPLEISQSAGQYNSHNSQSPRNNVSPAKQANQEPHTQQAQAIEVPEPLVEHGPGSTIGEPQTGKQDAEQDAHTVGGPSNVTGSVMSDPSFHEYVDAQAWADFNFLFGNEDMDHNGVSSTQAIAPDTGETQVLDQPDFTQEQPASSDNGVEDPILEFSSFDNHDFHTLETIDQAGTWASIDELFASPASPSDELGSAPNTTPAQVPTPQKQEQPHKKSSTLVSESSTGTSHTAVPTDRDQFRTTFGVLDDMSLSEPLDLDEDMTAAFGNSGLSSLGSQMPGILACLNGFEMSPDGVFAAAQETPASAGMDLTSETE